MNEGPLRHLRFAAERWVQRGFAWQLAFLVAAVALVAALGGTAAWVFTDAFASLPEAVWWSFLRLTDPGYLGDDEGTALRVISTAVTVLGYVLFMGSLIAIMTQWLALTLRKLESGLTPIAMQHHFVILGWTNRTPETVKKLLAAGGRLQRFLDDRGVRKLRVVILADEVDAARRLELREHLGEAWSENQVFLRSGSSLQREHLERLDVLRAAVVMVPGADFELGGAELSDTRVVKTLLNLEALRRRDGCPDDAPQVVAEVFDPSKVGIARGAVSAPSEVIASDRLISRLLSQSLRHLGIAPVLQRLLTHREGNAVYLRRLPELAGRALRDVGDDFPRAVVLGAVRPAADGGPPSVHLDPTSELTLQPDDLLVCVAESHDACAPGGSGAPQRAEPPTRATSARPSRGERPPRRLLILGWGHKLPTLLDELQASGAERFHVTLLSRAEIAERERALAPLRDADDGSLVIEHVVGDYSLEHDLLRAAPGDKDHVLFLASSWMDSSEEADARTVLGLLLLRTLLRDAPHPPEVLVEFLDPDNERILGEGGEAVFVSPRILSHLLAHVALRPELNAVYDELICAGGSELELRSGTELGLAGDSARFAEIAAAARAAGGVALGVLQARDRGPPEVVLNPDRGRALRLGPDDRVVLLARVG